jgi:two-component system LytT family response regulator
MINYFIADVDEKNILLLKKVIDEAFPKTNLVGISTNLEDAEKLIRRTHPDLLFLDLSLPDGTSFELLDRLTPFTFEVIFTTETEDHYRRAFKYGALDYLVRPIDMADLRLAVSKAGTRITLKDQALHRVTGAQEDSKPRKLVIPSMDNLSFISTEEIIRCEAKGGYTIFHLNNQPELLSTKSLGEYEKLLPKNGFFRIHNSHIINLAFIKKYHRGRGGFVQLEDGTMIEVSTRKKNDFLNHFGI